MAEVPVRVLGGVRLESPTGEVRVGGLLAERLLGALVAADGAPVLTDALADVLWPTDPPEDRDPPLRMAVSRLRRRLVSVGVLDGVIATRRAYRLAIAPGRIDVGRFTALVEDARRLTSAEPDRAAALLDGALALWRGDPFGELAMEPWARGPVVHLVQLRLAAEEELAELDLMRHREGVVVDRLRLAVHEQPLRERRWAQLATALYRLGRQGEALRAVDEARTILREELGIDPGEGLQSIHRALLDQDPTLLASAIPLQSSLPSPEHLVGRDVDIKELERLLEANRLVTVHGLGGVGKSTIARAVAGSGSGAGRAIMVAHLDGVTDPEVVWLAVAAAVGLAGADDPADLPAAIAARLSARPTLLVLDGAEAGAETVAEVADALLALAPAVKLLVTSRVPISATGEVRYALDALRVDGDDGDSPAVELFLDRAGLSSAQLDAPARAAVVRVCELAGGLPLALELAAATTDLHGLDALATSEPAASGGAVLHEMVLWSLDVLPVESRQLLARTSLLPDGTSIAAVAWLGESPADGVRRLLAPLLQARLLGAVGGASTGLRYAAPEAVREVAGQLLTPHEADAARSLVLGHLLAVTAAVGGFEGRPCLAAVPLAEAEVRNIRHWMGPTLGTAVGLELAVSAAHTMSEIGLGSEGSRWIRRQRDALPGAEPLLQARATIAAAATQELALDVAELEQASAVMEQHEDWRAWLYLRGRLALALGRTDPRAAQTVMDDPALLERLTIVDDPWLVVQRDWLVGSMPAWIGRFSEARRGLDGIADRFLVLDDGSAALFILFVRAYLARADGDVPGATDDLARARELAASSVARGSQARIAAELAHLARTRGDPAAIPMLVAAIDQLERAGNARTAATERRELGGWRLADGDVAGGLADLRAVLPMLLRIDRSGAGAALAELALGFAGERPVDGSRLAGAAARLVAEPGSVTPAQQARVHEAEQVLGTEHPGAFAEGRRMDDEALIELSVSA